MAEHKPVTLRISIGSVYSILDQVFSLGYSFLFIIIIVRYLGVDDLGRYQFSVSVIALILVVTNFGVSAIANREIAKSRHKLPLYLGGALSIRIFISLPLTVLCVGFVIWMIGETKETNVILLILIFYSSFLSDILLINGALVSLHMIKQVLIINGGYKVIAVLMAFVMLDHGATLPQLLVVLTVFLLMVLLVQFKYIHFIEPRFQLKYHARFCKTYILTSVPLLSISIAELISLRIDSVMLGVMSTPEHVGLYTGAYNIYLAASLVPLAVTRVFFVNFVSLYRSRDGREKAFRLMRNVRYLFLVYSVIVAAILMPNADHIVTFVFGSELERAGDALLILAIGVPLIAVNRLYNYILLGIKENRYYLKISVIGAVFNIIMNLILIPILSIVGAALATVATEGLMLLLAHIKVREGRTSILKV